MNKFVLTLVVLGLTQAALAKGGGNSPSKLALKNSQAGFVSESLENSMQMFVRTNSTLKDLVQDANIVSQTPNDSTVTISLSDNSTHTYNCTRFDDWSNSGTVLKKEVVCRAE